MKKVIFMSLCLLCAVSDSSAMWSGLRNRLSSLPSTLRSWRLFSSGYKPIVTPTNTFGVNRWIPLGSNLPGSGVLGSSNSQILSPGVSNRSFSTNWFENIKEKFEHDLQWELRKSEPLALASEKKNITTLLQAMMKALKNTIIREPDDELAKFIESGAKYGDDKNYQSSANYLISKANLAQLTYGDVLLNKAFERRDWALLYSILYRLDVVDKNNPGSRYLDSYRINGDTIVNAIIEKIDLSQEQTISYATGHKSDGSVLLKYIISKNPQLSTVESRSGFPLYNAARHGHGDIVELLLSWAPALKTDLNQKDPKGRNILLQAAIKGLDSIKDWQLGERRKDAVKVLVDWGANVASEDLEEAKNKLEQIKENGQTKEDQNLIKKQAEMVDQYTNIVRLLNIEVRLLDPNEKILIRKKFRQ